MSRSVKGKSAVVTGAGSGINLEFARILLKHGANVVIGDLSLRPEAQKLVDEYNIGDGPKAVFVRTDVTSWSDLTNLFQKAEEAFGTFDILCPGAGVFEPPFSAFWYPPGSENSKDDPQGDRYKSLDINLVHPIRATQLAITHFLSSSSPASQQNPKTIVHISSVAGESAFVPVPLYIAAKWGLRGFIYTLAELEQTRHIRVAGVGPAVVRTPLWLDHNDKKVWISSTDRSQEDWVYPEEVADVMFKLCTENEMSNSKGEKVPLKGGSFIEVVHEDVRDVPMYGAEPPGTGTAGKGLLIANYAEAWNNMNTAIDKIQAGGKA